MLLALFSLALASVELTYSYRFYQVNAYKIALALLLISALVPLAAWAGWRRHLPTPPPLLLTLWALPLLVTLPGAWVTHGQWAYGAPEQLTQGLVVMAWAWLAWSLARAGYGTRLLDVMYYLGAACALMVLEETARLGKLAPGVFRALGSFGNPGYLAGFLLLILPLGLARALQLPGFSADATVHTRALQWSRWGLDTALAVAVVAALLINRTRIAQLITLFVTGGTVLWLVVRGLRQVPLPASVTRLRPLLYPLAALITIGIGGLLVARLDIWARFQVLMHNSEWQGRLVPWQAALAAFQDSPWLGHGPGSYYSLFFSFVDAESRAFWIERSYFDPHNLLLDMAVEGGMLGVIVGIGVWLAWLVMLWQSQRVLASGAAGTPIVKAQRYQTVAVLAGLLLMLAFSLTAVSYRMMTLMLPAQVLLAATLGMAPDTFRSSASRHSMSRPPRAGWLLLLALVAAAWLIGQNALYSKHRFVAISALPQAERFAALQTLNQQAPNIYALERLLQESLIRSDWTQFFKTARQMEQTIPHYRTTRHVIAQAFLRRGDWRNARKAALDFQQRDRYFADNNKLLIRLAILTHDDALLMSQLKNAMRYSLHKQGYLPDRAMPVDLRIGDPLSIEIDAATPPKMVVAIPKETIDWLIAMLKTYYREGNPQKKLDTGNAFRFFLAPLVARIQQETGKDRFVEDMLLQLI